MCTYVVQRGKASNRPIYPSLLVFPCTVFRLKAMRPFAVPCRRGLNRMSETSRTKSRPNRARRPLLFSVVRKADKHPPQCVEFLP